MRGVAVARSDCSSARGTEAPAQPVLGAPHRSRRRGCGLRAIQGGRRGIGGARGRRDDQRPQRGEQQRGGRRARTDGDGGQTQVGSFEGPCIETAARAARPKD